MPRPSAQGKLMAAAMASFQTHGYQGCTIEEIATRAGVFKGSFYNHFKSKEALAVTAVEQYIAAGFQTLLVNESTPPCARLKAHFEALAAAQMKTPGYHGCLLANFSAEVSDAHPALRAALDGGVEVWGKALARIIRQGQAQGEISRAHKAATLARFIINAWEGATVRLKVTRSRQPLDDFFGIVFEGILPVKKG